MVALGVGIGEVRADRLEVEAKIDPVAGVATGTIFWTVSNPTDSALDAVELFLYPRIYREDPDLDDVMLPRVYPLAFDAGDQSLLCEHELVSSAPPVAALPLSPALQPGEQVTVQCDFQTLIPRKYGTFGRTARTLTMNGGLHPMPVSLDSTGWLRDAPPPPIEHEVQVDFPQGWGGVVGDELVGLPPAGPVPAARPRAGPRRWVSIGLHADPQVQHLPLSGDQSVTWVGRPLKRLQRRWVRRAAEHVRETLEQRGLRPPDRGFVLVEAPLRRNLVEVGDGVVFVSDRYLECASIFWRYHDIHLARALLADAITPIVDAREAPRHAPTTLHGVSWSLLPGYLQTRWKNHVNLERLLQRVRFLPAVDTLLETPIFPFADQIFDNPWVVDPIKADVGRFNRPLRSGRVLFLQLDDVLGEVTVAAGVDSWLTGPAEGGDLWSILGRRSGVDVRPLAERWLGPAARESLSVESVRRSRDDDGFHVTEVTVRRDVLQGEVADRVVEVRLDGPGLRPRRGRVTLVWAGREAVASWEVRTAGRVGAVTVDPRGRVLEVDADGVGLKRDNRAPRQVRVTGYAYFIALEATGGLGLEAYAALNFRLKHDLRNHVLTRVFTNSEVRLGAGLSHVHYFGRRRQGGYLRHRVVTSVEFDWLDPRFLETDAPLALEMRGTYVYETRLGGYFPTRGGRVSVSLFTGKDIALRDDHLRPLTESGYAGVDVVGVGLIRLHPWHVIAVRGKLGVVAGNVEHRQFTLGGSSDLRGIPANHVVGNFRGSATVEWRHFFVRDADVRMPFSRFRGLQGSLFVEAGLVSPSPDSLPGPGDVGVSVGYGLRVYGDWFGVLPAVGGIEIAWSPSAPEGRIPWFAPYEQWPRVPFQVYLVGSQSF